MRLTLAEFTEREISPAAVAQCLCLFLRTADGQLGHASAHAKFPEQEERLSAEEETLMMLQVGGSGALWREATGNTGSSRPSSLIMPSAGSAEYGLTSSASESRLTELGVGKLNS